MKKALLCFLLLFALFNTSFAQQKHTFGIKDGNFVYDGRPIQIHSGEMHFARVPKAYWKQRLEMI
jgi:beta-galactosidase